MANHKSAEKRIRANETKRVRNRYQAKTTRTQVKKLVTTATKDEAQTLLKQVSGMIDKLAKKNVIHWKKAANQKSKLARRVNAMALSFKSKDFYFSLLDFGWGGFFYVLMKFIRNEDPPWSSDKPSGAMSLSQEW